MSKRPFSEIKAECDAEQDRFENSLMEILPGLDFSRITCDPYDNSVELYDVPIDVRLNSAAVDFIKSEGFSLCWLNHIDGWETLYRLCVPDYPGWRKRQWKRKLPDGSPDPSGLIELEKRCDFWPNAWYESGYVTVIPEAK